MNILVVGWPDGELERAAFEQVAATAEAVGHRVVSVDLVATGFRAAMPPTERGGYHDGDDTPSAEISPHVAAVREADALVFVFSNVATSIPPPLRGWLERVMLPGVAFVFDDAGRVRPGLRKVRHIIGVATYDSPWWRLKLENDNGRRVLLRALRLNTGLITRTRWIGCYRSSTIDDLGRSHFLARIETIVAGL